MYSIPNTNPHSLTANTILLPLLVRDGDTLCQCAGARHKAGRVNACSESVHLRQSMLIMLGRPSLTDNAWWETDGAMVVLALQFRHTLHPVHTKALMQMRHPHSRPKQRLSNGGTHRCLEVTSRVNPTAQQHAAHALWHGQADPQPVVQTRPWPPVCNDHNVQLLPMPNQQ